MITYEERLQMGDKLATNHFFDILSRARSDLVKTCVNLAIERSRINDVKANAKRFKYLDRQEKLYKTTYNNTFGKFNPLYDWWLTSLSWASGWLVVDIEDMKKDEIEATVTGIAMANIKTFCIVARKDLHAVQVEVVRKMGYDFTPRYAERPISVIPIRKDGETDEMLSVYFFTRTEGGL